VRKGPTGVSPCTIPFAIPNAASALVSIDAGIGFLGPNYSISMACATSNHCLHSAADQIWLGRADVMVASGAEAAVAPVCLGGFVALPALSRRSADPGMASRPWDRDCDGFVLGEGAGMLVRLRGKETR
jgi:3-oxoacyl-[acyl-carrier-protein] synthase II